MIPVALQYVFKTGSVDVKLVVPFQGSFGYLELHKYELELVFPFWENIVGVLIRDELNL